MSRLHIFLSLCLLHSALCLKSFTFSHHLHEGLTGAEVSVIAGNPVACGGRCLLHPDCGAYVYRPTEMPNCGLLVAGVGASNNPPIGKSFSGVTLSTGGFLVRLSHPTTIFPTHVSKCEDVGLRLVRFPSVMKDFVATGSHGQFYFDLKKDSETSPLTTNDGSPVDDALFTIADEPGKTFWPKCYAANYMYLFRMGCSNWVLEGNFIMCEVTPTS